MLTSAAAFAPQASAAMNPYVKNPTSATIGVATTFQVVPDGDAPTQCLIFIMGPSGVYNAPADMTLGPDEATYDYTYTSAYAPGSYPVYARCRNAAGTWYQTPTVDLPVSAPSSAVTSVSAPMPNTATIGTPVTFTSTYAGPATLCLIEIMGPSGIWNAWTDMTRDGTTASYSHTYSASYAPGSYPVNVRCRDAAGIYRNSATTNVTVSAAPAPDGTAPVVSTPSPASGTVGVGATISATFTDAVGVTSCDLYEGGFLIGSMSLSGTTAGTASRLHTFEFAGSANIEVRCRDAAGNTGTGSRTVSVGTVPVSDVTAPVVSSFAPTTGTVGTGVTITANYSDAVGVTSCDLYEGSFSVGSMSLSGDMSGTASRLHTFEFAGSLNMEVRCRDAAGNTGTRAQTIIVSAPVGITDTISPIVSTPAPSTAIAGTSVSLTAGYTDAVGVTACSAYVGGSLIGTMSIGGAASGSANRSHTFATAGTYAVEVRCRDAAGNTGMASTSVTVSTPTPSPSPSPSTPDTTPPAVSPVSPTRAQREASQVYSVSFADANPITGCTLYVQQGGRYVAYGMSRTGVSVGYATQSYMYWASVTPGSYNMYASCIDTNGNTGTGPTTSITVETTPTTPIAPPSGSYTRQLVKLRCPAGPLDPNHPCKAVYYVTSDGKRHAFPNERAYFSWYPDFNNIFELDSLSSFMLGNNVTYRPGIRLVKFTTVNRVYAVGRNGLLRWITSETAARALYGTEWNRQVDDISDAFYSNYRFGADINAATDYSPMSEASAATIVDQNY